jgi:hypothetical protein
MKVVIGYGLRHNFDLDIFLILIFNYKFKQNSNLLLLKFLVICIGIFTLDVAQGS